MDFAPLFFSLLFFAAFAVYLFFGLFIIHLNPKSDLNRLFLMVCVSLCLWSFGFSMANFALDAEACLFWRRVSALGWTSIYPILMHFLLLLTGRNTLLKHRWFCVLLYLPAMINMYVFSLSSSMTATQYNLVRMRYGWTNVAVNNGWDIFFYLYYTGYLLACLGIVWAWQRRSTDDNSRRQATLIFYSFLSALLLGSLTDIILSSKLTSPLPQMAPVVILIPIIAIYYSIRRYGLMNRNSICKDEQILDDEARAVLFHYVSIGFLAGGLLGFLSEYLPHILHGTGSFYSALLTSGLFIAISLALQMIQRIRNEDLKYSLNLAVLLLSIPVVTLRFLPYASKTVWVFPIILIISSLVFNRRSLLLLVAATAIATQILVYTYIPETTVQVNRYDYLLRIAIFGLALWIGLYVNQIYVKKLKENVYQIGFQRIISENSFDFMSVSKVNFNQKTDRLLEKIGVFFQADCTYVFLINPETNTMSCTHEWCREGVESEIGATEAVPLSSLPWWTGQLQSNKVVCIEDIGRLPSGAASELEQLTRRKITSLLSVPIEGRGTIQGFLGVNTLLLRECSPDHIKLLKILANLLADGLTKLKAEEEIEFMAYYDHLTGLPNRTLLDNRLEQAIHLAKQSGKFLGVMFIDLDSFKTINDTMGHSGGDILIQEVAQRLVACLGRTDTVSRFGGDEFLILLNNVRDDKDVAAMADSIIELFKSPFNLSGQEFFLTGSVGVAVYPFDGEDAGTLTKNADIAMYKAKARGKNQYALCTTGMKEEVHRNMMLSNSLYRALERQELSIYYQPQVSLRTGQIAGIEALLRWKHPQLGMISPGIFIPLAEKSGLINSIGEWVLQSAVVQTKKWQEMGLPNLRMAVNLSINQFKNPRLADHVGQILNDAGLAPEYLELEITESIAIIEADYITDILNSLKKLGVSISIDDFGTEYSSLNRLKILPLDRIKIDMQFVQGIEENEKDQAITKVIINLAKSLGLEVLAEGVETARQSEFLTTEGCDEVQGYYYYKPMLAEEFEQLLLNQ